MKCVLKIFQTKIMKNEEIFDLKQKELGKELFASIKGHLCLTKRH